MSAAKVRNSVAAEENSALTALANSVCYRREARDTINPNDSAGGGGNWGQSAFCAAAGVARWPCQLVVPVLRSRVGRLLRYRMAFFT